MVDSRDVAALGLLELAVPALELALDIALPAAEVAQADGVDVDGVDLGQNVDQRLPGDLALLLAEDVLGRFAVPEDVALDIAHYVERLVVHRLVLAQPDGRRHGHGRRPESGDDAELAAHVVGGGQDAPERGAAQHPRPAGGVVDPEREVRAAPGNEVEGEGRLDSLDVLLEPAGDVVDVDAFDGFHGASQPTFAGRNADSPRTVLS